MCLLALLWQQTANYPLLLAGNRDEFHQRPTRAADFWPEDPRYIGGKDLQAGGSWLLATPEGRWAALTNVREPSGEPPSARSRGELVMKACQTPWQSLVEELVNTQAAYAGYNLLWGDTQQVGYFSNRGNREPRRLNPGTYLLSNAGLDTPWPKTEALRQAVMDWQAKENAPPEQLFAKLADKRSFADQELPDTGIGIEWERFLSPIFIQGDHYGTRASTLLSATPNQQMTLWEKSFNAHAELLQEQKLDWTIPKDTEATPPRLDG